MSGYFQVASDCGKLECFPEYGVRGWGKLNFDLLCMATCFVDSHPGITSLPYQESSNVLFPLVPTLVWRSKRSRVLKQKLNSPIHWRVPKWQTRDICQYIGMLMWRAYMAFFQIKRLVHIFKVSLHPIEEVSLKHLLIKHVNFLLSFNSYLPIWIFIWVKAKKKWKVNGYNIAC